MRMEQLYGLKALNKKELTRMTIDNIYVTKINNYDL